jgi:transposase
MPPSTPPRRHLTRDQRLQIRTLRGIGLTYERIASHLKVSYQQVQRACQAEQSTPKKHTGRPSKLSQEQVDELIAYIRQSRETRRTSYLRLATKVFPHWGVGEYAIRSSLRRAGYRRYIALAKPPLSEANRQKRLDWAREHIQWTPEQWYTVLWSDETWVNGTRHRKTWVTRQIGEELDETCLVTKRRRNRGWMFWASFSGIVKGPSLFWEKDWGSINKKTYCERIIPLVHGWIRINPGLLFMQDNAPGHAAGLTIEELRERDVNSMVWPPFSPDLNPIETLWNWMKDYIQHAYGHLENPSYDTLRTIVKEAWEAITIKQLQDLVQTMQQRCQDVIDAEGGFTKW